MSDLSPNEDEVIWIQKYRPKKIADCIFPQDIKKTFQAFVEQATVPNLLLSGNAGVGKTTVAKALCEELGAERLFFNSSLNGGIDTLRHQIQDFASTVSVYGNDGRKMVILDEADQLSQKAFQPALRAFMEEFSRTCGFILTANHPNQIIAPLLSRTTHIDFNLNRCPSEIQSLKDEFSVRVERILREESIEYEQAVIINTINRNYPDFRKILNEVHQYSLSGAVVNVDSTENIGGSFDTVWHLLKNKRFAGLKKWVALNRNMNPESFFNTLYEYADDHIQKASQPVFVKSLSDYQARAEHDKKLQITMMALFTDVLVKCKFV